MSPLSGPRHKLPMQAQYYHLLQWTHCHSIYTRPPYTHWDNHSNNADCLNNSRPAAMDMRITPWAGQKKRKREIQISQPFFPKRSSRRSTHYNSWARYAQGNVIGERKAVTCWIGWGRAINCLLWNFKQTFQHMTQLYIYHWCSLNWFILIDNFVRCQVEIVT